MSVTLDFTSSTNNSIHTVPCSPRKAAVQALNDVGRDEIQVKDLYSHPTLCKLVCLWSGRRRWGQPRHHYKKAAMEATCRHGGLEVTGRQHAWRHDNPVVVTATMKVSWKAIRRITGATV